MSDTIDRAILEARRVAASDGAEKLRKDSKGQAGTGEFEDEERLRRGVVRIWNPNRHAWENFEINAPSRAHILPAIAAAREKLMAGVNAKRDAAGA